MCDTRPVFRKFYRVPHSLSPFVRIMVIGRFIGTVGLPEPVATGACNSTCSGIRLFLEGEIDVTTG
jgi:hypothetical protein